MEDGFTEVLPCVTEPLHEPILTIVRAPGNEVIDILLEIGQKTPDFPDWITDEANRKLGELVLAGDEISINLPEEFR